MKKFLYVIAVFCCVNATVANAATKTFQGGTSSRTLITGTTNADDVVLDTSTGTKFGGVADKHDEINILVGKH